MEMTVRARGGDRLAVDIRGHEVLVDVPEAGDGTDTGPTATELFVAGLAACVAYYAEMFLRHHGHGSDGLEVGCSFTMSDDRPARVASVDLDVPVPEGLDERAIASLQRVLEHCSVHNSLRLPPEVSINLGVIATA